VYWLEKVIGIGCTRMDYCKVKYFTKEDAEHMHAEEAAQAHHR